MHERARYIGKSGDRDRVMSKRGVPKTYPHCDAGHRNHCMALGCYARGVNGGENRKRTAMPRHFVRVGNNRY